MSSINKCKKCGELPFAEHIQRWFVVKCCGQEFTHIKFANLAINEWNANNPNAYDLFHKVNEVNVSADFNEKFGAVL